MNLYHMTRLILFSLASALLFPPTHAAEIPSGNSGFESHIKPFFKTYCVGCHGPKKSKGKITLHSLDGDLVAGQELERWELILDALEHEDMPPEEEENQPSAEDRAATLKWIESGLRDYVKKATPGSVRGTTSGGVSRA